MGVTDDRAEVDFDHLTKEFEQNRHHEWSTMRARCPVAHNPNYGGFWVVSGYDEVVEVSRDAATFSSKYEENSPDGLEYIGIMGIPRVTGASAKIAEVEGPDHVALRRILNPFMLPSAVAEYLPFAETLAIWLMDQKIAEGRMDLVSDFTNPVPAILTMKMVGLPCESWPYYAEVFHGLNAYGRGTPEFEHASGLVPEMVANLLKLAEVRRSDPRDDISTKLVEMTFPDGRRMSEQELVDVLWNLIGGGLDTSTSLTSLSLYHLDAHHDLRQRLIDEPELLSTATEEFLRFTTVNETLTRTVTKDTELGGQKLHAGDFLMVSWMSANFDEKIFDCPDEVILDRSPNPHMAFGIGPHRCIGMHIARAMFKVMVNEVLKRIPDYQVDRVKNTTFYTGNPLLAGAVTMPITFTPGLPVGVERPF